MSKKAMKLIRVRCKDGISFSFSAGGYTWKFEQAPYQDWEVSTKSKILKNAIINISFENIRKKDITATIYDRNELEKEWLPSLSRVEIHDIGRLIRHTNDSKEKAKYNKFIDEMVSMENIFLDVYKKFSEMWKRAVERDKR